MSYHLLASRENPTATNITKIVRRQDVHINGQCLKKINLFLWRNVHFMSTYMQSLPERVLITESYVYIMKGIVTVSNTKDYQYK